MEVQKPKPWSGWREFLKEIGTIVIGVLIALGAEQAVEAVHWRHEVEAERQALRKEIRDNLWVAAYSTLERPCIDRRLSELAEVFRRQARGAGLGLTAPVARPPIWGATTGSWEIALAGQALGHMPLEEKLAFSDGFDSYKLFKELREQEDAIWRRLGLVDHADLLGPGDWAQLHAAYGEAVAMNERMKAHTAYVLGAAALGEQPSKPVLTPADRAALRTFCAPFIDAPP